MVRYPVWGRRLPHADITMPDMFIMMDSIDLCDPAGNADGS
jgi:hypothetical protein